MAAAGGGSHTMVDPHFHFLDPEGNPAQHATLLKAHPDLTGYLPEAYQSDVRRHGCLTRLRTLCSSCLVIRSHLLCFDAVRWHCGVVRRCIHTHCRG